MSHRLGKALRLSEFLDTEDGKSVIIEADRGLMLGPIAGLIDLDEAVKAVKSEVDAVVLSPGQVGRLNHYFRGRDSPALIVRVDWTNAFRDETSILPAQKIMHVTVASVEDAIALGASSIIAFFFVGYKDDEDEAQNMRSVAMLARDSDKLGVPLLVESIPIGERVTKTNYANCVDLAMRMAVEAGADAVGVPYTGDIESFRKIVDAAKVPLFMLDINKITGDFLKVVEESLEAGASGIITGKRVFQTAEPTKTLQTLRKVVHKNLKTT